MKLLSNWLKKRKINKLNSLIDKRIKLYGLTNGSKFFKSFMMDGKFYYTDKPEVWANTQRQRGFLGNMRGVERSKVHFSAFDARGENFFKVNKIHSDIVRNTI